MRTSLIAVAALGLLSTLACADAPITAADLQADGQLRPSSQQSVHHASSEANRPKAQRAERLRVTGLLAPQSQGALEDSTRFSVEGEAIYLHLRADDLTEPRPVTFVWTHGDERRETMGFLQPAETLAPAASLLLDQPLAREGEQDTKDFDPLAHAGAWSVEVYSTDANGRSLVFERTFEVLEAETFAAYQAEQVALVEQGPA
ncbi:hypothetical protein G6O69_07900 [Pseudenhygromyxa sp. WMMC2535]|uniref:hypothetical protein n=1 Tax=Pseudenhygromyxa sp. WMMC2535 TaxID=2712867 RepID=UPI00155354F8|nr:hypothetical protein [Pseudenhygromyxa sp. WMMC2535]NVB37752.1 hypothetical protein [Pseudenhygromyxa sp. WMMC2535]